MQRGTPFVTPVRSKWAHAVASLAALATLAAGTTAGVTPAVAAPHGPRGVDSSLAADALAANIGALLIDHVRGGRWGVLVVSLSRGDTLYAKNQETLMQPASTLKLFTTGLALDRFGPDYKLATEVLRDGAIDASGVIDGNVYLRGGGDPSLSMRFLGRASPMNDLARAVAASGVTRIRGDLVADASAFDDQLIPDGWKKKYLAAAYAAPVSALSLNENVVWVVVTPAGGHAEISLEPASTAFTVSNNVMLRPDSRGGSVSVRRKGDGTLDVRGWIGARSAPEKYSLVV